jgi:hypothetical protein
MCVNKTIFKTNISAKVKQQINMCFDKFTLKIINDIYMVWKIFIQLEKTIIHIWTITTCHLECYTTY